MARINTRYNFQAEQQRYRNELANIVDGRKSVEDFVNPGLTRDRRRAYKKTLLKDLKTIRVQSKEDAKRTDSVKIDANETAETSQDG